MKDGKEEVWRMKPGTEFRGTRFAKFTPFTLGSFDRLPSDFQPTRLPHEVWL
jgi:hypothetical protein